MGRARGGALSLKSLNHISLLCSCLEHSVHFYRNVLGFVPIKRPSSFNFNGAWLFNYGFGIHLLQVDDRKNQPKKLYINPNDNHISFQCESLALVENKLKEMGISYIRQREVELGLYVDQLFFHDPDGFMVKVCEFENLPMIPLPSASKTAVNSCMQAGQLPPQAAMAEAVKAATADDHNPAIMLHSC